jgi:hypothetical protein
VIHLTATQTYRGSSSNVAVENALSGMVNIGSAKTASSHFPILSAHRTRVLGPLDQHFWIQAAQQLTRLQTFAHVQLLWTPCVVYRSGAKYCTKQIIPPANISVLNDAFAWSIVLLIADGRS